MTNKISMCPEDEFNRALLENVHPATWVNPEPASQYNLLVLGAGTAGLITALGAAGLGARVALVENFLIGGDCLNFGCVPSKAILRSSRMAAAVKKAPDFGLELSLPGDVDFSRVMERMRRLRSDISRHDSVKKLQSQGVEVFLGDGAFQDKRSFSVAGKVLRFKKAVIATGTRPTVPPIPGLEAVGFLTNETLFSLTEKPGHMIVIGGGPIGCELAQAFRRLGSEVTIIQKRDRFLPREDSEVTALLAAVFAREGIRVRLNTDVLEITHVDGKKCVRVRRDGEEEIIKGDEILVGVGRTPNVKGLNLEAAGVAFDDKKGIQINAFLQTTNRKIFAAGDVCFPYKFTHAAEATARIAIQNALFVRSKKVNSLVIPWCTYTDPEIAHVGLYAKEIQEKRGVDTFTRELKEVDRAILDGDEEGFVKVQVKKGKDKILGATIVARHAGEMINEITLAMSAKKGLRVLCNVIHPYPTQAEAIKQAASQYYVKKFSPRLKRLLLRWFQWRR